MSQMSLSVYLSVCNGACPGDPSPRQSAWERYSLWDAIHATLNVFRPRISGGPSPRQSAWEMLPCEMLYMPHSMCSDHVSMVVHLPGSQPERCFLGRCYTCHTQCIQTTCQWWSISPAVSLRYASLWDAIHAILNVFRPRVDGGPSPRQSAWEMLPCEMLYMPHSMCSDHVSMVVHLPGSQPERCFLGRCHTCHTQCIQTTCQWWSISPSVSLRYASLWDAIHAILNVFRPRVNGGPSPRQSAWEMLPCEMLYMPYSMYSDHVPMVVHLPGSQPDRCFLVRCYTATLNVFRPRRVLPCNCLMTLESFFYAYSVNVYV